uniref:Transcriptional protein SWT1 n=1 Tax=Monopterus albus TaxID=43700 RepID=A0A3Q3KFJ0_MONAL|nr:transcriptional protein SWT1 [Monopterus albus]
MSKKSKKRRRRKSSCSTEEDEASKEQDIAINCETAKRKRDVNSRESFAAKPGNFVSSTVKNNSPSTRQVKKPVYRLAKTHATGHKTVNKDKEYTTKSVTEQFHGGNCSSKPRLEISGKDSGSKTAEKRPSKPLLTDTAGTVCQRTQRFSKGSLEESSSQRIPSKLKQQPKSLSLVPAEQKEWNVQKKRRAEEPPKTGHDYKTVKASSVSRDSLKQNRIELVKKFCQRHHESNCTGKMSLCTESKNPSVSVLKESSTSAKPPASESSFKNVTSVHKSVKSTSHMTAKSSFSQKQMYSLTPALPPNFKMPKKVEPRQVDCTSDNNEAISTNTNLKHGNKSSDSGVSLRISKHQTVQQPHSCLDFAPSFSSEEQDKRSSLPSQLPTVCSTDTEPWHDEMQVVEELHLARSEKRLEVNVMQCYGELTCMDIDLPEERATNTHCKQPTQQNLILILDTNILLSHLDYVKKIRLHGLEVLGFPVVLIPWVVLQELDSLKKGKGLSGSVAHLAAPAISYIYNSLKSRDPHLWGQSMQQATESNKSLNAENNDDRVLQCCLQYQRLYPWCAHILCTNDKNLCSKALLSGVRALSKNDLEAEVQRSRCGLHPLQSMQSPVLPCSPVEQHSHNRTGFSVGLAEKDSQQPTEETKANLNLSRCISELENCLQEVLSDVLEVEMKAAYGDLWLEIVYVKPPWTLQDVLQCLKKHWIAVFGNIVPRRKQQNVLSLIDFFNSGKTMDCSATLVALQEAKELVKVFGKRSSRVPSAISVMDNITDQLQPQGEVPAGDTDMKDDDAQISHQEVWALFENIWFNVYQMSLEVFKALGFDPHTMQNTHPVGAPPPPQEALAYLHKLSSMVSQLLQAFSSVLLSAPGMEEVQTLLSIIHANETFNVDSRLTAKDLCDCFSQQDYREKLRVGGTQLMELKEALDHCVGATGQNISFAT